MKTIISSQRTSLSFDYENQRKLMKEERFAGKQNSAGEMGHRIAKHSYDKDQAYNNGLGQLVKSTYYVLDAQGNTMATYERSIDNGQTSLTFAQTEKFIYGSARLGVQNVNIGLLGSQNNTYTQTTVPHRIGKKGYELSNHLGNVLSVISDKVIPHSNGATVDYWQADILQSTDYSPFGVQLNNRTHSKSGVNDFTRFGFQNQEMDNELKGKGNSVNFEFRMHDPRLGRFFAIDPLNAKYPYYTPYSFSGNRVISCIELEGLEEYSIMSFSFAPFSTFGGGFHGDGAKRKFNDKINFPNEKDRNSNFRIGAKIDVNLTPNADKVTCDQVMKGFGSYSWNTNYENESGACWSSGYMEKMKVTSSFKNTEDYVMSWGGYFHNYGGNCAAPAPEAAVPNIDVYMDLAIGIIYGSTPEEPSILHVRGNLTGDRFPANEVFIRDSKGQKIMLGVSGCDGYGPGSGPYTDLGTNVLTEEQMAQFDIKIELNADYTFKSITCGNKKYNLVDWNIQFKKISTTSTNSCTSINTSNGTIDTTE